MHSRGRPLSFPGLCSPPFVCLSLLPKLTLLIVVQQNGTKDSDTAEGRQDNKYWMVSDDADWDWIAKVHDSSKMYGRNSLLLFFFTFPLFLHAETCQQVVKIQTMTNCKLGSPWYSLVFINLRRALPCYSRTKCRSTRKGKVSNVG